MCCEKVLLKVWRQLWEIYFGAVMTKQPILFYMKWLFSIIWISYAPQLPTSSWWKIFTVFSTKPFPFGFSSLWRTLSPHSSHISLASKGVQVRWDWWWWHYLFSHLSSSAGNIRAGVCSPVPYHHHSGPSDPFQIFIVTNWDIC